MTDKSRAYQMFHVVLFQPEIPPNTGNIIRLCANCGARLHLIRPLGFDMSHKQLRRAGLDYHEFAEVQIYDNLADFVQAVKPARLLACSTKGTQNYTELRYTAGDAFLFGPETRGLPAEILESLPNEQLLRIPMLPENRSLNLSNATAIIVYEAWRQLGFDGAS
jgi:tRNA (cytidine/uridine-2'-O-)-methyltransferase